MLTDAAPRKANRAGFLESDRMRTLDLPQDGRLLALAESIEQTMKARNASDVRRACRGKPHHSSTESRTVASACLQQGRSESAKGGAPSFSATTIPRPC